MPYPGITDPEMISKMDKCVEDVQGQGHDKASAIAICHDSIMSGKELLQAIKEYAQKATAEDNNLPDSAFLYVEPGGEKDGEGKTVPRSLRHLPYRTAGGAVDLPRLRNALSRLGQANTGDTGGDKWLTASLRDELIAKARRILENSQKSARGKEMDGMILPDDMDLSTLLQGVEASLDAELTDDEMMAVEQLYRDIAAGKTKLESLAEPDAATGKASVSYGNRSGGPGGPAGNPSGTPGGSQGDHNSKQERCYLQVKKLGGDEATARKICRSMFAGRPGIKQARHYRKCEKAITDAPNLRADDRQSCYNCKYFESLPSEAIDTGMGEVSSFPRGICTKYEFETGSEWVCDSWTAIPTPTTKAASFTVYKQADGQYRWLAVTSSSFQDRDNEIVSQKALEADAERMNASGDYGTLDWWHTPIVLGACDFSAMHGRLSVESGTFRDAYIAEKMLAGGYEMSRAFYHPITEPDANGVYHNIKTFSRAVIPQGKGVASNRLTTFTVVKEEKEMLMDKVKELVARFGGDKQAEERVNALLAEAEQKEQAAVAAGIAAKETKLEAAPAEEKKESIADQPGMFVADMKPEEFDAHIATAINAAVKPLLDQLNALKEANAAAVKESSTAVLAAMLEKIGAIEKAQAETAQQVKELNGLTPRGYRATQDPATATTKDARPGADEKKSHFEQFVNGFVLGQPQPPMP